MIKAAVELDGGPRTSVKKKPEVKAKKKRTTAEIAEQIWKEPKITKHQIAQTEEDGLLVDEPERLQFEEEIYAM